MTPTAIVSLIKDFVILAVLGIVVYVLISYGKDVVKVADMKAVEQQIQANAEKQARWQQEIQDAQAQHSSDIATVAGMVGSQRNPVFLRSPTGSGTVPSAAATPTSATAASGPTDQGSGENLRPAINAFELKYETALADCRAVIAEWPY